MSEFAELYTQEGESLPEIPWNVYPRPLLKRDSFFCLNGEWRFVVMHSGKAIENVPETITVPFSPETLLSGVKRVFKENEYDRLVYTKEFTIPESFNRGRVLLHFGAVGNFCEVKVNNKTVGTHNGGYDPFYFDITDLLEESNTVVVCAKNYLDDRIMPYGKQCRNRGGMWYTETSGIWQTVWLESVPEDHIKNLSVNTDGNKVTVNAEGTDKAKLTVLTDEGEKCFEMENGVCSFTLDNIKMWSPEEPYLYYYSVETDKDRVESYFAFRTLEIRKVGDYKRLCLNGKPYFFHGLLDQGYWSDGGMTPPDVSSYTKDIEGMKSLGFNMLRKHIKIESPLFYYECDRLGMVVFQDMINNGKYNFLRDTALPTVLPFSRNMSDKHLNRNENARATFISYMEKTVEILKGYPSICCWTIFNEGWGQFCGTKAYRILKALDNTRFIDTASGWFSNVESDLDSRHIYFRKVKLKAKDKPLFLSEFGGYSYRIKGHSYNMDNEYGYGKYNSREEFVRAFCKLYTDEILPLVEKGLCASVYTQVSDVEDETNGLFTYDRRVLKVLPEEFLHISQKICKNER